jgi:hypothetical protein
MSYSRTLVVHVLTIVALVFPAGANQVPFLHVSGYEQKLGTARLVSSQDEFAPAMYTSALAKKEAILTSVFLSYQDYVLISVDERRKGVLDWFVSILEKLVLPNRQNRRSRKGR